MKHHQTSGSRSYIAEFYKMVSTPTNIQIWFVYKYMACGTNVYHVLFIMYEKPSPIEFFKATHTRKKDGVMSPEAQIALVSIL